MAIKNKNTNKIYISFVEEMVLNPDFYGYIGGRIEVHHPRDRGYHSEEIRFFTKNIDEFYKFRDEWDMKDGVTSKELEKIRSIISKKFMEPVLSHLEKKSR